jgi:hypothetical protein
MVAMVLVTLALAALPTASADPITVNRGSAARYLKGSFDVGDFPSAFTLVKFASAQTGTATFVLAPTPFLIARCQTAPALCGSDEPYCRRKYGDTGLYAITLLSLFPPQRSDSGLRC